MMYGWGWNGDWGGMVLAMLFNGIVWLVLLGLLIWGLSRVFGSRGRGSADWYGAPSAHEPSALEILRQRYARGEIDDATFERMRAQLERTAAQDLVTSPPRG